MRVVPYNRDKALEYAHKWAFNRNPRYLDFSSLGGDCTNFISQCIFAGSGVMNTTPIYGWYYYSSHNRSASWTGVQYLYNFLVNNKGVGPFAEEVDSTSVIPADIIQLAFEDSRFAHSLLIVEVLDEPFPYNIKIATHTLDRDYYTLSNYYWQGIRFLHIKGVRKY